MRVAVWQCEQMSNDVPGNLARIGEAIAQAAADGADLLVCPEMVLTGYAIPPATVRALAEPADGPSTQAIAAMAREHGVAVVWGHPELAETGEVFNSATLVDAQGRTLISYRKTHLFGDDDRAAFATSSGQCPIVEFDGWKVAVLICYDVEFPEAVRALALAGVDLVLVPTANMIAYDVVSLTLVPARACENQIFVAYANCCGTEGHLTYGGLSAIAAPDGSLTALGSREPDWLVVDLDRDHPGRGGNTYLRDRRPELYTALTRAAVTTQP